MFLLCRLFADDNSLQQSSYDMFDIKYKLNYDLQTIETWSNKWLLKFVFIERAKFEGKLFLKKI